MYEWGSVDCMLNWGGSSLRMVTSEGVRIVCYTEVDHLSEWFFAMKLVLLGWVASPMSVLIFRSWQHCGGVAWCCKVWEFSSSYNPLFCTLVGEFTVAANLCEPEHGRIRPGSQLICQCLPWAKFRLDRKLMVAVRRRRTIVHSLPPSCTSPTNFAENSARAL